MRKEIFWVAGIGIILGIIFAFGVYRVNSILPKNTDTSQTPNPKVPSQEFKITLDKPEPNDVVTQDSITVSGITKAGANIVISAEESDYITQSSEKGAFEAEVDLISGVNQIKVTAADAKGGQSVTKVLVVYSSAFELKTLVPSEPTSASGENSIRDKVAQKVAEALNNPKAFLGTVTDIADSTIQIKSTESQIEQISLGEDEIVVVNTIGKTNKTVKLTDIAIGDFIVAMGYVNTNSVLSAQRILITSPVKEPSLSVLMAEVSGAASKLTISRIPDGTPESLTPTKDTDIYDFAGGKTTVLKFASLSEGNIILYVLDSATTPALRSIFRIAKP